MKPDPAKYEQSKERLRVGLRKIIADCEDVMRDITSWNDNRPDAEPFDIGPDLMLGVIAKQVLELVEADQRIPDELWDRMTVQAEARASE